MPFKKDCLFFYVAFLSLFLAFEGTHSVSLGANGKITGKVMDGESKEVLPGANVIIESVWFDDIEVEMDQKMGASVDVEGFYVIMNVPPGTYTLKAMMMGYKPMAKQKVRVGSDRSVKVSFNMINQAIAGEEVVVTAEKEIIKADVSSTQEILSSARIRNTPVLRMDEFMNKVKGVQLVSNSEGNGLSIRGGSIRETDIRMDGVSMRDPRSDNSYMSFNSSTVEEIQVLTGGFEAKYGDFRSGLVNVVTKEGKREKYDLDMKIDMTPGGQEKFFGDNPWAEDSWIYKVYADTTENGYAWVGTKGDTTVPADLRYFRGWQKNNEGRSNYESIGLDKKLKLTPEQKRELWLIQHPTREVANEKDVFVEGALSGPLPGENVPFWGSFSKRTTFLLGFKYEKTQFVFPIGPRDNYKDVNFQFKLTTKLNSNMKISLNGMTAKMKTITSGKPSTFGGALADNSNRFNFMNNSESSIIQQAGLLGGSDGFLQMYNKSRLQYYDIRYYIGGIKFTHTLTSKTFYNLECQFNYVDHELVPYSFDPEDKSNWTTFSDSLEVMNVPEVGSPNASTNWVTDINDFFWVYGGLQSEDSSYSWSSTLKFDLTSQVGRHHQVEAGMSLRYNHLYVNSGTWLQSKKSYTPDTWQYFEENPLEGAFYVQDKLEFEGMIAKIGFRGDYFNPMKKPYDVKHPLDKDFSDFYHVTYNYLPGESGSWERWEIFRDMLDEPEGWPTKKNDSQFKISPRLGVSFPVTVSSKLYFNYGHFYQRPNVSFLYDQSVSPAGIIVPTPELEMARTIAYEFGYEQKFLKDYLFNVTMYYKDVKNEPLSRTYVDYYEEMNVTKYFPDAYRDIRGIEFRLEKNYGRFLTFWSNYEYILVSSGRSGVGTVYENRMKANQEQRDANIYTSEPRPTAHGTVSLHTPRKWGPMVWGAKPFSSWNFNFFLKWEDKGKAVINPHEPESQQKKIEIMDYYNVDLRISKNFRYKRINMDMTLTVKNLLNIKRLSYGNMTTAQYDRYKESLKLPYESGEEHGNDKLGEWDKDYIDVGWFNAPLFLNPRQIVFGLRFNL